MCNRWKVLFYIIQNSSVKSQVKSRIKAARLKSIVKSIHLLAKYWQNKIYLSFKGISLDRVKEKNPTQRLETQSCEKRKRGEEKMVSVIGVCDEGQGNCEI